ncbi:hypothetical protein [Nitratireductor sp. GCM10026969]|uniref:hypothetical protein n=1 Tax=Nitratireductor sp. GCM10026969 TaxID=3252645 RepID=UPI00366CF667
MTKNKKGGRPPALQPDKRTLATIRGLGRIQATTRECAAVLGVSHPTFLAFIQRHPEAADILEQGKELGKRSLRRQQFKAAEGGHPTMLVWLGKQYLDQTDKQEVNASVKADVTHHDARSKLESLIDRQLAARADQAGTGKPH